MIPNKPIRFVVNTHVHFDHSGGLHACRRGATVVTHQANVAFYEKAWAAPQSGRRSPRQVGEEGGVPIAIAPS